MGIARTAPPVSVVGNCPSRSNTVSLFQFGSASSPVVARRRRSGASPVAGIVCVRGRSQASSSGHRWGSAEPARETTALRTIGGSAAGDRIGSEPASGRAPVDNPFQACRPKAGPDPVAWVFGPFAGNLHLIFVLLQRYLDQLAPCVDADFLTNMPHGGLYGSLRDLQLRGDFFVRETLQDTPQHGLVAVRQCRSLGSSSPIDGPEQRSQVSLFHENLATCDLSDGVAESAGGMVLVE